QTPDHGVADLLDQRRDLPELDGMGLRAIVDPYEAIDAKLDSPSVGDETEKGLRGVAEPLLALAPFDHLQNARGVEPRAQAPVAPDDGAMELALVGSPPSHEDGSGIPPQFGCQSVVVEDFPPRPGRVDATPELVQGLGRLENPLDMLRFVL